MVTLGDLITRDFDGPADEAAGNVVSILLFPIIVPIQVVYYSAYGTYKLGQFIKKHNPVKYRRERRESMEKLQKMAEDGINPFLEPKVKHYVRKKKLNMNVMEQHEIISEVEKEMDDYKKDSYKPNEYVNIYPVDKEEQKVVISNTMDYTQKPKILSLTNKR